jgi:HEAT repeat protein
MPKSSWLAAVLGAAALGTSLAAQAPTTSPSPTPPPITEIGGKTLTQWKSDLKHRDPSVRSIAMLNIVGFGERAGEAVPLIIDRCEDRDASCRAKAVLVLKVMYVPEQHKGKVVAALAKRLAEDSQGIIRYEAAQALQRYADDAHEAVPALLTPNRGVDDSATWEIRQVSIMVLRRAAFIKGKGPEPRATRALIAALKDTVEKVRLEATIALGAMGPPADPMMLEAVVRALDQQLAYADKSIALWSHVSLLSISNTVPEKSLAAILKLLRSPERDMRLEVLHALQAIGHKAKGAVPTVIDCLEDKEPAVVAAACITLAGLGDTSEAVRSAIIKVSERKDRDLVYYACVSLAAMGGTPDVLDALTRVSKREELDKGLLETIGKLLEQVKKAKK